ncbi:hypothetical protein K6119_15180 [Paracrocinitomix mangrovi]|uniref:hypothetical protein n=1 Tax=Paracrocinitomix mangrovi TaxID=2862509 RepID=UPI001C8ED96F|nr:hypothetical protein [Paracrocinitomix mangrovi]UKN01072.1 hypothetical protein K6119_15180 [Paracrocinitomix mangrovi]
MERIEAFFNKNISVFLIASLTLGLAPFAPEPHIWGKLKWIAGGAVGMQPMDWFDTLMHGTPWILLLLALLFKLKSIITK